jgi:hypothetical protein
MFFIKILIKCYKNFNSVKWASQDISSPALVGIMLMQQGGTVKDAREYSGLMARGKAGKSWRVGKITKESIIEDILF